MADPTTPAPKVSKFKTKKLLTRALMKLVKGEPRYLLCEKPIYLGKEMPEKDPTKKPKDAAHILECLDLETGEEMQFLVPAVVQGVFKDTYPNESYVGKGFEITKMERQPGKGYDPYRVAEIEIPDEFKSAVERIQKSQASATSSTAPPATQSTAPPIKK